MAQFGNTRHGTPSGWARHQYIGETPCDLCRVAKAEYDARWRRSAPRQRQARIFSRAQARANKRLKELHPGEYRLFYEEAVAEYTAEARAEENDSDND